MAHSLPLSFLFCDLFTPARLKLKHDNCIVANPSTISVRCPVVIPETGCMEEV